MYANAGLKVKGSVCSSIKKYIKDHYQHRYQEWEKRLPPESKPIFVGLINVSDWYDAERGVIVPTALIADMFFDKNIRKAAWEMGRYGAEVALKGIYKVFVMIASPKFMIERASKIMITFYAPTTMVPTEIRAKGVTLQITEFPGANEIIEYRIGGWIEKALEICGCKELTVKLTRSFCKGDSVTEFTIDWK